MADNKVVLEVEIKGNSEEKTKSLRAQMKALREELGRLPEGTAEFNKVQKQLGELTDKVGDLGRGVNTLAGDPLERLNNSFGMIGSSITSLDFGAAQQGLKGMSGAIKDFKIKDATAALKGFGSTAFELGKSLLLNPLFSIPALVVLIITKMDSLISMGGKIGAFFQGIKDKIDAVWNAAMAFLDATGLIDSKAEQRAKDEKKRAEETKKLEAEKLKKQKEVEHEKEKLAKEAAEKEAQRIQKIKDDQRSLTEFLKAEQEKRYQETLSNDERDIRQLRLLYLEKEKLAHGNKELLKQLDASYQADVKALQQKQAEDDAVIESKGIEIKKQSLQIIFDETKNNYQKLIDEDKKRREQEIANEQASQEARIQISQSVLGSLMALNDAFAGSSEADRKRAFNRNKALGIAQATIQTYQSATAAYASQLTIPSPDAPIRAGIAAGAAITAGLAQIAVISRTKYNGGSTTPSGGGGGMGALGSGGGGSTSAPALDLSFLNNKKTGAQPIQSYVLATNVTSAQDAQQKILDQSKLIK